MFQLSNEQMKSIKGEISRIHAGGQDAAALAWLVWAEVYLAESDRPGPPIESLKKLMPLILWIERYIGGTCEQIQENLRDSILRILFNAKLEGRELSEYDGHHAILIFRSSIKEADG